MTLAQAVGWGLFGVIAVALVATFFRERRFHRKVLGHLAGERGRKAADRGRPPGTSPPARPLLWAAVPAMIAAAVVNSAAVLNTSREAAVTTPAAAMAFDKAVGLQRAKNWAAAAAAYKEAKAAGYDPALSLFGVAECC